MSNDINSDIQPQANIVSRNVSLADFKGENNNNTQADNNTTQQTSPNINNSIQETPPSLLFSNTSPIGDMTQNIPNNLNANTVAVNDLLLVAAQEKEKEEKRKIAVETESKRLEEEKVILQKYIYNNANPSPLLIISIVIGVILVMWLIYTLFLKPTVDGEWRDGYGSKINICHNKFSGSIKVYVDGDYGGKGLILDNYVKYGDLIGIWDYNNQIVFIDGTILYRVL